MKRLILSACLVLALIFSFSACGQTTSMGLEFKSNNNGTCTLVGMGKCTDITVVVPEKNSKGEMVVAVAESAFKGESSLTVISLPTTVTEIGEYAFANNRSLIKVELPQKLTKIDSTVFSGCTSLDNVTINPNYKYSLTIPAADEGAQPTVYLSCEPFQNASENAILTEITKQNKAQIYASFFGDKSVKINEK